MSLLAVAKDGPRTGRLLLCLVCERTAYAGWRPRRSGDDDIGRWCVLQARLEHRVEELWTPA